MDEYESNQTNNRVLLSKTIIIFLLIFVIIFILSTRPGVVCVGSAAETPSPMPMPLRSSQESTGSFAWGGSSSQPDAVFSQGTTPSQKRTETGTPVPWSQGRYVAFGST